MRLSEISTLQYILTGIFGPLVLLVIWGRWKLGRKRRSIQEEDGREKRFVGTETPRAGWLPGRFTAPQRTILRQQIGLARGVFLVLTWFFFVLISSGLLPSSVAGCNCDTDGAGLSGMAAVWYSLLSNFVQLIGVTVFVAAFVGGVVSVLAISTKLSGFYRTRPVSRSFLYWARVLPSFGALLGAYVVAVALTLLAMRVFYGPLTQLPAVWQGVRLADAGRLYVPHAANPFMLTAFDRFVLVLQTSAPRLFVSMATRMVMFYSLAVLYALLPIKALYKGVSGLTVFYGGVLGSLFLSLHHGGRSRPVEDALFLYLRLGPPPPWGFIVVPLGLAAIFLVVASVLNDRLEV